MMQQTRTSRRGFTLVELIVTLGIVTLLAAIAIPGLARLGAFSRDEFRGTVQDVTKLLRSAQIYATTYHVNTAVVYTLDNFSQTEADDADTDPTEDPGDPAEAVADPVVDSITGDPVRQIVAAAIMYQLPSTSLDLAGKYVPVPTGDGQFTELREGMTILLQHPEVAQTVDTDKAALLYNVFDRSNYRQNDPQNFTNPMGWTRVPVALGIPEGLAPADMANYATDPGLYTEEFFAAHLFQPNGRMSVPGTGERFSIFIGPEPARPANERLVNVELGQLMDDTVAPIQPNMQYREIQLFKSTGRIEIPKNF